MSTVTTFISPEEAPLQPTPSRGHLEPPEFQQGPRTPIHKPGLTATCSGPHSTPRLSLHTRVPSSGSTSCSSQVCSTLLSDTYSTLPPQKESLALKHHVQPLSGSLGASPLLGSLPAASPIHRSPPKVPVSVQGSVDEPAHFRSLPVAGPRFHAWPWSSQAMWPSHPVPSLDLSV